MWAQNNSRGYARVWQSYLDCRVTECRVFVTTVLHKDTKIDVKKVFLMLSIVLFGSSYNFFQSFVINNSLNIESSYVFPMAVVCFQWFQSNNKFLNGSLFPVMSILLFGRHLFFQLELLLPTSNIYKYTLYSHCWCNVNPINIFFITWATVKVGLPFSDVAKYLTLRWFIYLFI